MFYVVIEQQLFSGGAFVLLYNYYTDVTAALARYHTVCAAAVVSDLPYHAVLMLQSTGQVVKQEVYDRRTPEPTPEPEPEPEEA